jgi:hypothetical protein
MQTSTDQNARPPHPELENRANQERNGRPDEVNGSGMATSYCLGLCFSTVSDSELKNCVDTRCASRWKAMRVAWNLSARIESRCVGLLLAMVWVSQLTGKQPHAALRAVT